MRNEAYNIQVCEDKSEPFKRPKVDLCMSRSYSLCKLHLARRYIQVNENNYRLEAKNNKKTSVRSGIVLSCRI